MFISKFWGKKILRDKYFKPLFELENEINSIRSKSDFIAICPAATGNSWQGVLTATLGLFSDCTLVLPQYYSHTPYTEKELSEIARTLQSKKFRNIVFSGFPTYFEDLIKILSKQQNCHVFYHGFLAELAGNSNQQKSLELVLKLYREGFLKSIAVNKKGLNETFSQLNRVKTKHLLLKTPVFELVEEKYSKKDGKVHIGVLVNNQFRKNPHNQVAGALMVPNSIVYTSIKKEFDCFGLNDRIIEIPPVLSHEQYIKLLGAMDINTHVTFAESWGQVITESLMLEVPCLASLNSGIFDFDKELAEWLIVKEFDNSAAIADQIKRILPFKEEIGQKGREYVLRLNKLADERINEWLDD